MKKYPIEQSDIDAAMLKIASRESKLIKVESSRVKIHRAVEVIKEAQSLPILPLDQAIKRLGDDEVYRKASKGFRFSDDD